MVDNRSLASITDVDGSSGGSPSPKSKPLDLTDEPLKIGIGGGEGGDHLAPKVGFNA